MKVFFDDPFWVRVFEGCDNGRMSVCKAEILNQRLYAEFCRYRNYVTLERYVMSELLSPIEDYTDLLKKSALMSARSSLRVISHKCLQ